TRTPWDDALIDALRRPLGVLVWIVGIALAAETVQRAAPSAIFSAVGPLRDLGVVVMVVWFVVRFIRRGEAIVLEHERPDGTRPDYTTVDSIAKLLRLAVFITGA
ncbi:MAG: mechanosensitive ion channel family protein, partial [Gammaproteobacteria bacterium]|nr:mechanosensitive ion channel family protein [Gammaproteobacteria bacterium]NIR99136.1 mechanosensitive ion channel family protein [Gammaproteobacteria bacterium]NIT64779.1 mechanosensitive ion channel family protein [Gammaproteobacteria bacterium]NIV21746.1 mechanosensitive ion channel family protein [Gammaproteobacteria bacterium]NIX10643.1 mechanosensitive ion channel family protein [Gammaproteobacteria bacterium]